MSSMKKMALGDQINLSQILDTLYLFILAIYLLRAFFDTALLSIPWPGRSTDILRTAVIGVVLLKIGYSSGYRGKGWLAALFIASVFWLSWMSTGYWFLFEYPLLILGTKDIPYKKILKVYFWCGFFVVGTSVMASLTGAVRDLVYVKDGMYRHSFGICYTTDFAAHVIYLLLVFWVAYERVPAAVTAALFLLFALFQFRYCNTECSEVVALLSVVGVLYVWLVSFAEKWAKKKNGIWRGISRVVWLMDRLLTVFMGICAGCAIWMSIHWAEYGILLRINDWISGRLRLAKDAFDRYGFTFFGTAFDMIGAGGDTTSRAGYNFVDSSFCMILVRYGIAVLAAVLIIYFVVERKALKNGDRKLMVAFALVSIHSLIEHHLLELAYDPFILLAFAEFSPDRQGWGWLRRPEGRRDAVHGHEGKNDRGKSDRSKKDGGSEDAARKDRLAAYIGYCIGGILILLMAPKILQYGRTIVTILELHKFWRHRYFIIALSAVALAVVLLIKWTVDLICLKLRKERADRRKSWGAVGCGVFLLCTLAGSEYVIKRGTVSYEESLSAGRQVILALQGADLADLRIYVDDIPVVYERQVQGLSDRVLSADSAVSKEGKIVLLARKDRDIFRLMEAGCWFGELSDRQGIYTDSEEAVRVLEGQGIAMHDYYSVQKEEDLADLAGRNGLELSEGGSLLIEGADRSLIHGAGEVIYRGRLRVEYTIRLLDSSITDGELAKARLSFDWGERIIKEQPITRADLDENGCGTVVIEEWVDSLEGGEFLLFADGDTRMLVESIRYGKVGK